MDFKCFPFSQQSDLISVVLVFYLRSHFILKHMFHHYMHSYSSLTTFSESVFAQKIPFTPSDYCNHLLSQFLTHQRFIGQHLKQNVTNITFVHEETIENTVALAISPSTIIEHALHELFPLFSSWQYVTPDVLLFPCPNHYSQY